jgi:hypothetical protein
MLRIYPSSTKTSRDNTLPVQPCTTQDEHRRNARGLAAAMLQYNGRMRSRYVSAAKRCRLMELALSR